MAKDIFLGNSCLVRKEATLMQISECRVQKNSHNIPAVLHNRPDSFIKHCIRRKELSKDVQVVDNNGYYVADVYLVHIEDNMHAQGFFNLMPCHAYFLI